jgi:hypothetical protein
VEDHNVSNRKRTTPPPPSGRRHSRVSDCRRCNRHRSACAAAASPVADGNDVELMRLVGEFWAPDAVMDNWNAGRVSWEQRHPSPSDAMIEPTYKCGGGVVLKRRAAGLVQECVRLQALLRCLLDMPPTPRACDEDDAALCHYAPPVLPGTLSGPCLRRPRHASMPRVSDQAETAAAAGTAPCEAG